MQPMTDLSTISLSDPDGKPVVLGEIVDRPTLLVLPRYYGCLPCRDYLRTVADGISEVEGAGGAALSVSTGTDYQARHLIETYGFPFPLLVDSERELFGALELKRKLSVALNPKGYANYARAIARGNRQGKPTEPLQMPGLAILDGDAKLVRVHRGKALGDYPPFGQAVGWLVEVGAAETEETASR